MSDDEKEFVNVFSKKFTGGPLNIGEPEDRTLRHLEEQILITKIIKDRAHHEKCKEFVQKWGECMEDNGRGWRGLLTFITCKKQVDEMNGCLLKYYQDPDFKKYCENVYLDKRTKFRQTGVIEKDPYHKKAYYETKESRQKREFFENIRKNKEKQTEN